MTKPKHYEEIKRYISTNDYHEFVKWIGYMVAYQVEHKAYARFVEGNYICKIEIIGKDSDEIEEIKKEIGFYFDQD